MTFSPIVANGDGVMNTKKKRGLPLNMMKRGDVYYASFSSGGRLIRRSLSKDFETAKGLLHELMSREFGLDEQEFDRWLSERSQKSEPRFVYFIEAVGLNRVKIGIATNVEKRLQTLRCGSPIELKLFAWYEPPNGAALAEMLLHQWFGRFRVDGSREWFEFNDSIKRFALNPCYTELQRARQEATACPT